jgi:hypothetical protein
MLISCCLLEGRVSAIRAYYGLLCLLFVVERGRSTSYYLILIIKGTRACKTSWLLRFLRNM